MKRGMLVTELQAPQRRQESTGCAAQGCPLPATFHGGEAGRCCAIHVGAERSGWPKATAVANEMQALWTMAREAECAAFANDDEIGARALFSLAAKFGLTFSDPQREVYKRAGIKRRAAGLIVQTAIAQAARDAAVGAPAPVVAADAFDALAASLSMKVAA